MDTKVLRSSEELTGVDILDSSTSRPAIQIKRQAILDACNQQDIGRLRDLADQEGGLLEDALRRSAWPLLLGCHNRVNGEETPPNLSQELPPHQDEEQVQKDVDRAFVYYPTNESQKTIDSRKSDLFRLILRVLRTYRMLHYFQGYHDIVQVFLLVLGPKAAFSAVSRVSLLRIRDYMLPSMKPAEAHLQLIPAILNVADPILARHLSHTPPFFALSATITLYAHDIQEYSDIARLYDFILAHEPVLTIYLFVSLVIHRRSELLDIPAEDPDMLLFTLSKLPQSLDLDSMIENSLLLYTNFPPSDLPGRTWRTISSYSVLKTSTKDLYNLSLKDGEVIFAKQSKQLYREQLAQKVALYVVRRRKPFLSFGLTILVGLMSYWLRKSGNDRILWASLWRTAEVLSDKIRIYR